MIVCQYCNRKPASVQSQQMGPHGRPMFVHLCDSCFSEMQHNAQKTSYVDRFGRDMTKLAHERVLDPVIGRTGEIERLVHILARRTKNNPVLVGEPGVGKTAIVEGLAQRIAEGRVVETLRGKRLISLDIPLMLAGAAHRGEFEQRLKRTLEEVTHMRGSIILFIDELHTIVGAGAAHGAIDAANMLKPSLSRGEVQIIGATTIDEYRQIIERDGALERRFQPIFVDEPSVEDTVHMLTGLRASFEEHHHVTIADDALESAAVLSDRYLADRFLPDKAIDVLDEAASSVRLKNMKEPETLRQVEQEILYLEQLLIDAASSHEEEGV